MDTDEAPAVISGTRRQIRELVDGSLEVRVHIDPRFKADFHRLFPQIDVPIAIAPLALDFERIEKEEKEKVGPLCKLACIWCGQENFREWLSEEMGEKILNEEQAADAVRSLAEVVSRKDIDRDPDAADRFKNLIRTPFMEWARRNFYGIG